MSEAEFGVADAKVLVSDEFVVRTDQDGRANVRFHGHEGDAVEISVLCPQGFEPAPHRRVVKLETLPNDAPAPRVEVRCKHVLKTVVVALRMENGSNLPVIYRGKEVSRTDASGAAHLVLKVNPGEVVSLFVDAGAARDKRHKQRPERGALSFTGPSSDDYVILEQKFESDVAGKGKTHP
jgi:hypothetical protein